ncbi:hypothetical protein EH223_05060 [candidate division KSB1 bacterium]|nr:hypothetical protein [candidate division KSB1 bacterium]RQW05405.1 MAG: hypothetical protein EH223_05060 [candidate division KSB1 bacterium]
MKRIPVIVLLKLLLLSCSEFEQSTIYVDQVSQPRICLNGVWKVTTHPPAAFWSDTTRFDAWQDIRVPGECAMQGIPIKHDEPFVYKTNVLIPNDYSGKSIFLQFDGVYSFARVWANGNRVREHHGGFTRWQCDITPFVQAGKAAIITVEVTDRIDDISCASGYAKHRIGGILRDVHLLALPKNFPHSISITADLDDEYKHAMLCVSGKLESPAADSRIELELIDDQGQSIKLNNPVFELDGSTFFSIQNSIKNPRLWDAEHPIPGGLKICHGR